MVKIELISEAQAVVETTKGPAGARLRGAIEALADMAPWQALRIVAEDGDIGVHKVAFQKASAATGKAVRLRLVGNTLYVMHEHGEQEPVDEAATGYLTAAGEYEPAFPLEETTERADESLARTRAELDAAIGGAPDRNACPWHLETPHEHDAEGRCILPEVESDGT